MLQETNKTKLKQLLSELYEAGETTEDIVKEVLNELTNSEQIDVIDTILTDAPKEYRYYEMLEEMVEEVAVSADYKAASLITKFDEKQLIDHIKESDDFEELVIDYLKNDEYARESVLFDIGDNVIIPNKLFTDDKKSKLEEFIQFLFPYYNDQAAIKMNF